MYKSKFATFAATAALLLTINAAHATLFNGSYTVTANTDDSVGFAVFFNNDFGLLGSTTANSATSTISLSLLPPASINPLLFDLGAIDGPPYTGVQSGPQPITVGFNFTSPFGGASGIINGTLLGGDLESSLVWSGPLTLFFGNHTFLDISLSNATFDNFNNGNVTAKFDARVPEPGTLALLGIGLLGVAFRRKQTEA